MHTFIPYAFFKASEQVIMYALLCTFFTEIIFEFWHQVAFEKRRTHEPAVISSARILSQTRRVHNKRENRQGICPLNLNQNTVLKVVPFCNFLHVFLGHQIEWVYVLVLHVVSR